jgi:colanic acid/amylovoran biosynthesis protein
MRIFIFPSAPHCDNLGDVAMLQIAIRRLKELWPATSFQVLTDTPQALKIHCPGVEPVPMRGCKHWLMAGVLPRLLFPAIPPEMRAHFPLTVSNLGRLRTFAYPPHHSLARKFTEALFNSDLVVLSGAGVITDVWQRRAMAILNTFDAAIRCGIPTAMLGQGFGPIQNPTLCKRAAEVLPRVNALCIREQRAGLPLLEKMDVSRTKIFVTGDDAIEPAFCEKRQTLGTRLGVNLRIAGYSALDEGILGKVRDVLFGRAQQYQTSLVGIPISFYSADSDVRTLERLLIHPQSNADMSNNKSTPNEIIRQMSNCRIVVTGSYHAGVFALAQGIPVVGIIRSAYYRDKFQGLAGEFGAGCVVLPTDEPDFSRQLPAAIDELWERSAKLKLDLLSAAERQIKAGQSAYAQLPKLLRL